MRNDRTAGGTLLKVLCGVILAGGGFVLGFVVDPQAGYEFGFLEYMLNGAQVGLVLGVALGVIVGDRLTRR